MRFRTFESGVCIHGRLLENADKLHERQPSSLLPLDSCSARVCLPCERTLDIRIFESISQDRQNSIPSGDGVTRESGISGKTGAFGRRQLADVRNSGGQESFQEKIWVGNGSKVLVYTLSDTVMYP